MRRHEGETMWEGLARHARNYGVVVTLAEGVFTSVAYSLEVASKEQLLVFSVLTGTSALTTAGMEYIRRKSRRHRL